MARLKMHPFWKDEGGRYFRTAKGLPLHVVTCRLPDRLYRLWARSRGCHPEVSERLKWLKDPHRIGEYFWRLKLPVVGDEHAIEFIFTHHLTALEFKFRWG